MKNKKVLLGSLLGLSGGLCGGISSCLVELVFKTHPELSSQWLLGLRMLFGGLLILSVAFARGGLKSFSFLKQPAVLGCFLVFALSGMVLSQYGYFETVRWANAATGTVLKATSSVFVLLIVCVGGRRLPRWQETAAILVCTAGTWLLCTHGDFSTMQLAPLALFFGLSSAFGNALYTVLSTRLLKGNDPWAVIGGAIFLAGVIFCTVSPPWHTPVSWDMPLFGCVAGIVVIGTVGGYMLHLIGTGMVGPVTGILLAKNETVTSIILSVLVLGRRFAAADYLGFVMVLGSVILISVSRARQTDG